MTRILAAIFVVIFTVISSSSADLIVPAALIKYFPFASTDSIQTLTDTLNNQTTISNSKKALKSWVPDNWKPKGAKIDGTTKLANPKYALKMALPFIDYRFSLKKYIDYLYNQAIKTELLSQEEAENMKSMYWEADKKTENSFKLTSQIFLANENTTVVYKIKGVNKIKPSGSIKKAAKVLSDKFSQTYPQDFKKLWYT